MLRMLLLLSLLAACSLPGTDDDDASADDDDAGDDDTTDDDDDSVSFDFESIAFSLSFEADAAAGTAAGELAVHYEDAPAGGQEICRQRLRWTATLAFGGDVVQTCPTCTGRIEIDPESVLDVSNPDFEAADCDPAVLVAAQANWGQAVLTPRAEGGRGDFLLLGLIDIDRLEALGLAVDAAGTYDAASLRLLFEQDGAAISHLGYVLAADGSMTVGSGVSTLAGDAGAGGDDWLAWWQIFRDPAANPHEGVDLSGAYLGRGLWNIDF